jgi:hypothetical protein
MTSSLFKDVNDYVGGVYDEIYGGGVCAESQSYLQPIGAWR